MNYNEAVEYIFGLRKFASEPGVVKTKRALELLNNPEKDLKVIHVAGTNGKGSVCSYISKSLIKLGFNVGMFTSPHLVKVNERIRLNNEMISDEDFMKYFEMVLNVSKQLEEKFGHGLAFFDFVLVMGILYYRDMKPDYVVLETGLGGRLDSTSAIENKILAVITSISLDHTEILGNDIATIAAEKAGIIVPDVPVVYWGDDQTVKKVMSDAVKKCNTIGLCVDKSTFKINKIGAKSIDFSVENEYYENSVFSIGTIGVYQAANATLALCALSMLDKERQFDRELIREAVACSVWEGRMEEVIPGVYVDGAHNPDGIKQLLDTVKAYGNIGRKYLLFGAVCEKDHEDMIRKVCQAKCFDGYVLTQINNQRALDLAVMQEEFSKYTDKPVRSVKDNEEAFNEARKLLGEEDVLICAGSLYLVGAIKELIGDKE